MVNLLKTLPSILLMILEPCLKKFIPGIDKNLNQIKNALTKMSCLLNPWIHKEVCTLEVLDKMDTPVNRESARIIYHSLSPMTKPALDDATKGIQSVLSCSFQITQSKTIEKGLGKMFIDDILEARSIYKKEKANNLSPEKLAEKGKCLFQEVLLKNINDLTEAVKILGWINRFKPGIEFLIGNYVPANKPTAVAEISSKGSSFLDRMISGFEEGIVAAKEGVASAIVSVGAWGVKITAPLWLDKLIDESSLDQSLKDSLKTNDDFIEGVKILIDIAPEHLSVLKEFNEKYNKSVDLYSSFVKFLENTIVETNALTEEMLRQQLSKEMNAVTTHFLENDLPVLVDAIWAVKEDILNCVYDQTQEKTKETFVVGNKTYKRYRTRMDGACLLHAARGKAQDNEFCWLGSGAESRHQFVTDLTKHLQTRYEVMAQFTEVIRAIIRDRKKEEFASYFERLKNLDEAARLLDNYVKRVEPRDEQNGELEKICSHPAIFKAYLHMILQDEHWFTSEEAELVALVYGMNIKVLHQANEVVDLAHDFNPTAEKKRIIFLDRDQYGRGTHYWRCKEIL
jgi:hypothetical protein